MELRRGAPRVLSLVAALSATPARAEDAASPAPPDVPAAPAPSATPPPASGEQVIADPELAGLAAPAAAPAADPTRAPAAPSLGEPAPPPQSLATSPPPADPGRARGILRSRVGVDTAWEDPREEVVELTTVALLELDVRRSERQSFAVGLRALHRAAWFREGVGDARASRAELDVTPTDGHLRQDLSDRVHLRLGYQSVQLGRFDLLGATNFLASVDLRQGPTGLPEGREIAQPALRADVDLAESLDLRLLVLPFFQPHLVSFVESDTALLPGKQADVDAAADALVSGDARARARLDRFLRDQIPRSARARMASAALSAWTPDADLTSPQAAVRLTTRGAAGEAALTLGYARERLPLLEVSESLAEYARDPSLSNQARLAATPEPFRIRYGRYAVVTADGALDVGPVQLGAELSHAHRRSLATARVGEPYGAGSTPLSQLSLRAEYAGSDTVLVAVESFGSAALEKPAGAGREWLGLVDGRYAAGAGAFVAVSLPTLALRLELGGGVLTGPSYVAAPRAALEIASGLEVEAGAILVGGDRPATPGDPALALGGLYDSLDQVFAGLRAAL